ncbi:acetyl-CoA hydrolase/transferase C-terminal domain-containing protein [Aquabacterium sp. OR-4]|uniref:acetyl-CoA hydrolase/transferase C-terminal domain-containing protein n=1 Tax=Aquabacterium sp. OR-4 TaxID=2978127 RepID=UPI0028C52228|nr:acetyl-CoA hydrolase/transferase C-terminal domain-containing protein [Aquabacterium sp. OR-4]MDT7835112.1 acetyl-CoA hydrolase/transferase C-terminal domain-containing protein [Aquabacterium sp. OR-4]
MNRPRVIDSIDATVDAVLDAVPGDIVLGIPLAIGKPNPWVNALYRRIKANPSRRLTIITALSLERPVGKSELERHFLEPLVERVFTDYPDLEYVKDLRGPGLPPHIEVREFFMKTGDYLGNSPAQQNFISTNYTFVARDMLVQGMNVIAQAVGEQHEAGQWRLSVASNPDIVFEVVEKYAAAGLPLLKVGVVNRQMPFMPNGAQVTPDFFDIVCTDAAGTHQLFGPPNGRVSSADYAIGLHASSLVADGGTLQIGIGSLGDAIAQALIVRDRHGAEYRRILESLTPDGLGDNQPPRSAESPSGGVASAPAGPAIRRELGRFDRGLYGCSEMFVNGFLKLIEAGIIRREVFADTTLQQLLNSGAIADETVTPQTLRALLEAGRIHSPLRQADVDFLARFGIFKPGVTLDGDYLMLDGLPLPNDLRGQAQFDAVCKILLGTRLAGGIVMTGGFFLGPNDFYERLRSMPPHELAKVDMTRIDFINQLYGRTPGDSELKRAQRSQARFMNTTMMVTLLGAAASDGLESGQVVSGVGGQYNFVAMAHALPDARSILMLRATHSHKDGVKSSILWNYGHTTIPRHLRDIVITEYGVADLRGQADSEVVKRLIAIADSRFQPGLISEAKAHGKLDAGYELPARYRENLPEALEARLQPWADARLLPPFPFGTDLTPDELRMVGALKKLAHAAQHPVELVQLAVKSLIEGKEAPQAYLERLGLADAHSFKDMFIRKLFAGNL